MIAIETNHQDLETAKSQKRIGIWYFIVTHANGKRLPQGSEEFFIERGSWEEASSKAEITAKTFGCIAGKDSILLVLFTPD